MLPAEPYLKFVPSVIHIGSRLRIIRRAVFQRPPNETFHDFLPHLLRHTLGEPWWGREKAQRENRKHVLMKWFEVVEEWLNQQRIDERRIENGVCAAHASGYAQSLLQLSWDVCCLLQAGKLSEPMIERLRNCREFQGVRFEIAVASMFVRGGFEITYCEPVEDQPICEFIAKHRSGVEIAVEAKSRRRAGVLNEKGDGSDLPTKETAIDFKKRYGEARKKKPSYPFAIFLDFNLPANPEVPWEKSHWLDEIKAMLEEFPEPTATLPDAHNLLVFSSLSYFYEGNNSSKEQPFLYFQSLYPKYPLAQSIFNELYQFMQRYPVVPREI